MKRRTKFAVYSIVTLLSLIGGVLGYRAYRAKVEDEQAMALLKAVFATDSRPSWRSSLPPTATDVQEWAWADGFLPDYSYLLKARVTPGEFERFVAQLNLTPHTPERQYADATWLSWNAAPGFQGDWWGPSDKLNGTFVRQGGDTWSFAKYENGFLYFKSLNH